MPAYSTRCFHFDDDGLGRTHKNGSVGCPHGVKCNFTHPGDDGWRTAQHSHKLERGSQSPIKRRKKGRSRGQWGSDIEDDGRDSNYPSRQRRSLSPNISSASRGPAPSLSLLQLPSLPPPPSAHPVAESMKPMPIEPLVPPPPLPAPPEFLKQSLKEPSASEKEDVWKERFKLMSEVYEHGKDLLALEDDIKFAQRHLTHSYPFLPAEVKQETEQHLVDLEAQCASKRALRDATLSKLSQTNFWPIFGRTETEETQKKKYEEMVNTVADLHNTIASIHNVLQTAVAEHNWRVATDDTEGEGAQRSKKRRRVGDDREAAVSEDELSPSELSTVIDKVHHVEGRLYDLKNMLNQRDNDIMDEIRHSIEARYEDDGEPHDAEGNSETLAAVGQVRELVDSTGDQMGQLAQEVGDVIMQVAERSQETLLLKEKYARTLGEIAVEKARLEKQQLENAKIIESLQAGISDLNDRPPPSIPQQVLVDTVEEPIKEIIRSKITPLIDDFQREMDAILQTRNEDYKSLWAKLGVTQKMVNAIANQVNREQAGLVVPANVGTLPGSS